MNKQVLSATLWIAAFFLTVGIAKYQRTTGPTYPISGNTTFAGESFKYEIERTHGGKTDHPVEVEINNPEVTGTILWKRYKVDEPARMITMKREDGKLIGYLPHQPPAGKLEYQVILRGEDEKLALPKEEPAVIRFKGDVPKWALLPHILMMFLALFTGMRVALGAIANLKTRTLSMITFALIVVGGLIFGPIVQKFAFGAYWTGWPLGGDWTDNKTAIMALPWLIVVIRLWNRKKVKEASQKWLVVLASVVMFAVYLIPHSMHGSELDYSQIDSVEVSK